MLRFARKKSSIESRDITQFGSHYVRGVGLSFADSCKVLDVLVDTELRFHVHIRSIIGKSSAMSVNLLNSTLCRSKEFMFTLYISHIKRLSEFGSGSGI